MFAIFKSARKVFDFHKPGLEKDTPKSGGEARQPSSTNKIDELSNLINKAIAGAIAEYNIIREKMKNLSQTNYDLGMKYLNEGNLKEAIFRFRITKKFWPNNYDAYYQLVYCLILEHNFDKAQLVIDDLLQKNPSYKSRIDQLIGNQTESHSNNLESSASLANNQQNS